ncbi:hypothetical protein PTKIN_Ptkin06aG0135600 [Pterospermum kingtungense]
MEHISSFMCLHLRPRYRLRSDEISTNVLGVCTLNMQFVYVLPGWEGSAVDGRVLEMHSVGQMDYRSQMSVDPFEAEVEGIPSTSHPVEYDEEGELIQTCEPSNTWKA